MRSSRVLNNINLGIQFLAAAAAAATLALMKKDDHHGEDRQAHAAVGFAGLAVGLGIIGLTVGAAASALATMEKRPASGERQRLMPPAPTNDAEIAPADQAQSLGATV